MLTKRIIPCLDVKNGKTVKGVNFENLVDLGDPIAMASHYAQQGADELIFLDISATDERRSTMHAWVKEVGKTLNIPFTVGGGIRSVEDVKQLLDIGADKISINSAAIDRPQLIQEIAQHCGSQCVVVAIDAKWYSDEQTWKVHTHGGKKETDIQVLPWVKELTERGAGEILLTSIDHDGTGQGFAIELTSQVSQMTRLPIIASGGAGTMQHFLTVFEQGNADAALAAGLFHRNELAIPDLKKYLHTNGIHIRP